MSEFDQFQNRQLFNAVSSSVRQLYLLLRCINFASKAQVQISADGLRFSVEDMSVMEGLAFLDKSLFTSYHYQCPASTVDRDGESESPIFAISLPALLETLQIFGLTDTNKDRWNRDPYSSGAPRPPSAFDNRVLGITGTCRLSYAGEGAPLCVIIEEGSVTTTCELVTYEPMATEDIPFARDQLTVKIIMRASWLHDAVSELSSTDPERVTLMASSAAPFFVLSATGALGSAAVQFERDKGLLETFQVGRQVVNEYKFTLLKATTRAMAIATKVSIRIDEQGVLSLQFMIEIEGGGVSFVDFRFVPLLPEAEEDMEEAETNTVELDDQGSTESD